MYGFELVEKKNIRDINAEAFLYSHKSGARLLFLKNEDKNRVFMPVFDTLPEDNSGAAHIAEHCTLSGSEKYPLKDPFARLARCSVYTYLNAITYPDKTVYPVASTDERELYKMSSVYLDGVFKPLMTQNEGIFQQEGVRFENNGANGIVLNEMKGYFDNSFNLLYNTLKAELYKGCNYGNCSAGVPEAIEKLTYEAFKRFYYERYTADNCVICAYGDLDISRYMRLAEPYLTERGGRIIDKGIRPTTDKKIIEVKTGKKERISGAAFSGCGSGNYRERMLLKVLREALEAECKDSLPLNFVYNCDERSDNFFVSANADFDCFQKNLTELFEKISERGFSQGIIEGAVNKLKFFYREKDFGYKPKGLFYGLELINGILYENNSLEIANAEEALNEAALADYKELVNRYFAGRGVWGYTTEAMKKKNKVKKAVNDEPFLKFTDTPEKDGISGLITGRKPSDFNGEIFFPEIQLEKGLAFTESKGDIVYLDLVYPINEEDAGSASLYAYILEALKTGADFDRFKTCVGIIEAEDGIIPVFKISAAFMREKTESCVCALKKVFYEYKYNHVRKLKEKIKRDFYTEGEKFAILQSLSGLSKGAVLKNRAEGAAFYLWLNLENTEEKTEAFHKYIKAIKPVALLRGRNEDKKYILENLDLADRLPALRKLNFKLNDNRGLVINSQMNCNSLSLKLPRCGAAYDVAAVIAEQYYLWEKIRGAGGAYIAGCEATKEGFMYMYSAKDPGVGKTLELFSKIGEYLADLRLNEEEFSSALVRAAWKRTKPVKEKEINERVLSALFRGDTRQKEKDELKEMLALTPNDIKKVGYAIAENMSGAAFSAIGGEEVRLFFERYISLD